MLNRRLPFWNFWHLAWGATLLTLLVASRAEAMTAARIGFDEEPSTAKKSQTSEREPTNTDTNTTESGSVKKRPLEGRHGPRVQPEDNIVHPVKSSLKEARAAEDEDVRREARREKRKQQLELVAKALGTGFVLGAVQGAVAGAISPQGVLVGVLVGGCLGAVRNGGIAVYQLMTVEKENPETRSPGDDDPRENGSSHKKLRKGEQSTPGQRSSKTR